MKRLKDLIGYAHDQTVASVKRHRHAEYSGNGLVKVRLLPALQADLDAKLRLLAEARNAKVEAAHAARDQAIEESKAAHQRLVDTRDADCQRLETKAHEEYLDAEDALLDAFSRRPSAEEIALAQTKPGQVVRIDSTPATQGAT